MPSRRQFLGLLAGTASGALVASCGNNMPLSSWRGAGAFAVENIDEHPYLLALKENEAAWVRGASLADLKIEPRASVTLMPVPGKPGTAVLLWANGDGNTHAAFVDSATQTIRDLHYSVNSGARGVLGEQLLSILPAAGTSVLPTAELRPLRPGSTSRTVTLPFFPDAVGSAGNGLVLAASDQASMRLCDVSGEGQISNERTAPIPGLPLDAFTTAYATVITVASKVPGDTPGLYIETSRGEVARVDGIDQPRLVAVLKGQCVVVDDTAGGTRSIKLVRIGRSPGVAASADLPLPGPVRDLRSTASGHVVAVQSERITLFGSDLSPRGSFETGGILMSDR